MTGYSQQRPQLIEYAVIVKSYVNSMKPPNFMKLFDDINKFFFFCFSLITYEHDSSSSPLLCSSHCAWLTYGKFLIFFPFCIVVKLKL